MTETASYPLGVLERRHVLQLLGVVAVGAGIAACSKGGDDSSSAEFRAAYPYQPPPKGNFNLLEGVSEAITMGYLFDLIMIPGAMYLWDSQTYQYLLADPATTLSADGKTLTYKVRSGLSWSDGKPVTAADVYATWMCRYALGHAVFDYVDGFEQTDEMTVTFHIGVPAPIAEYYLLRGRIVPAARYGDFAAEAAPLVEQGAPSNEKATEALARKISAYKPKEATVSGPFNFDYGAIGNAQLRLVKNDSGYRAADVQWDSIAVHNGETNVVTPVILAKDVYYATHGFPVSTERTLERQGFRLIPNPTYFGYALFFNYGRHPEFADKRFRQAIAHAIDRNQAGDVALGKFGRGVELMAGFSDIQVPQWMPEAELSRLDRYEHDLDSASRLLTEAGWTKTAGGWSTPRGESAAYDLLFMGELFDFLGVAQSSASQLESLGIKLTLRGASEAQVPVDVGSGRFDIAVMTWGNAGNPFPTEAFRADLIDYNYPGQKPNRGMDFPLQQTTDSVGEIDLEKALIATGLGATPDALKANVTKMARAFNELLPIVPLVERYGDNPVLATEVAGFPPDNDPIYKNSIYADNFVTFLLYDGSLKPA